MPKVKIDLDEMWCFSTHLDAAALLNSGDSVIELPDEWLERYQSVSEQFFKMQGHLEHCYRHQMGLKPFNDSPFRLEQK